MNELVVISGKGGTGKTSIVAAFASLAEHCVLADADVDAADLHLLLDPTVIRREDFSGGNRARVISQRCNTCGQCQKVCRFDALTYTGSGNGSGEATYRVDPLACEGCGVCTLVCEHEAIEFGPVVNGELFVSETRCGPMVHARLGVAEENSGKLVTAVRNEARQLADQCHQDLIIVDGPPGIGCPVIASLTGASLVLAVTEPTLSGEHDLKRVLQLTRHFGIPAAVCVNKWDLNPALADRIERLARTKKASTVGRVRYDKGVTSAQIYGRSTVEADCAASEDIRTLWRNLATVGGLHGVQI